MKEFFHFPILCVFVINMFDLQCSNVWIYHNVFNYLLINRSLSSFQYHYDQNNYYGFNIPMLQALLNETSLDINLKYT